MPQRKATRVEMNRPIWLQGSRGAGEGTVKDFSLRGCRIHQADANVHCGMRLTLHLSLPDRMEPIEIKHAIVTWARKNEFGVEFSKPSQEIQARLKHVCDSLLDAQTPEQVATISIPALAFR